MKITKQDIEVKRMMVRKAYVLNKGGQVYEELFEELQDLTKLYMAQQYRNEKGLNEYAITPYCD